MYVHTRSRPSTFLRLYLTRKLMESFSRRFFANPRDENAKWSGSNFDFHRLQVLPLVWVINNSLSISLHPACSCTRVHTYGQYKWNPGENRNAWKGWILHMTDAFRPLFITRKRSHQIRKATGGYLGGKSEGRGGDQTRGQVCWNVVKLQHLSFWVVTSEKIFLP